MREPSILLGARSLCGRTENKFKESITSAYLYESLYANILRRMLRLMLIDSVIAVASMFNATVPRFV